MSEGNPTRELRLDSRRLALFFVAAVAVGAVFFALGFMVGRGQAYEAASRENGSTDRTSDVGASDGASSASDETLQASRAAEAGNPPDTGSKPSSGQNRQGREEDYRRQLDFYNAVREKKVDENFHPESEGKKKDTSAKTRGSEVGSSVGTGASQATSGPKNLISLQVAALKSAAEADRLAKALRSKGYAVFTVSPGKADADKLIRVQVGPFSNTQEASKVKARLQGEGYPAIVKR